MLSSLYINNLSEEIVVYALNRDLTDSDRKLLLEQAKEHDNKVVYIDIDERSYAGPLPVTEQWPIEAYFRLQMIDLLPDEVKRILYIDVDVIVLNSLKDLYYIDFEDKLFCVCKDHGVDDCFPDQMRNNLFQKHFQQGMKYFNSGMMLWNLEELRKKYNFKTYLNTAKELDYRILAPDQDLLNYIHWKEVKYVDEYRYNVFALMASVRGVTYEYAIDAITILHYVGVKPWEGDGLHYSLEKIWWKYAKKTPFYLEFVESFMEESFHSSKLRNQLELSMKEKETLLKDLESAKQLIQKLSQLL